MVATRLNSGDMEINGRPYLQSAPKLAGDYQTESFTEVIMYLDKSRHNEF